MLEGEQLVNLKHKPLEDKKATKIVGHTNSCQYRKGRCIEDMKRITSLANLGPKMSSWLLGKASTTRQTSLNKP